MTIKEFEKAEPIARNIRIYKTEIEKIEKEDSGYFKITTGPGFTGELYLTTVSELKPIILDYLKLELLKKEKELESIGCTCV